jgi:hypothetical protein
MNGAFTLPAIKEPPPYLKDLFTGSTVEAWQFQKNMRSFNWAFALTSIGCNIDWRLEDQGGIRPYAIHRQLSHHTGPLEIANRAHSCYAQIYIIDTERAINEHMRYNQLFYLEPQVNQQIVERLTHKLHECQNLFIEGLKTANERLQEAAAVDPTIDPVKMIDRGSFSARLVAGRNIPTENVPTTTHLGSVVIDTAYCSNVRDIVLRL